jgi:hypothetical protein
MFPITEPMPASKRRLKEIKINVPEDLLEDAQRLFEAIGVTDGDGHRDVWMDGVYRLAERYNKILVSRKLLRDSVKADETGDN